MLVVFVHFPTPLERFCGSIGVDIFFFISGFIIYYSIDRSNYYENPVAFLRKRLLRILPLYWTATALFIVMHLALNQLRYSDAAPVFTMADILRSFLFIPIENESVYYDPVIFLGWSLNFEMLFYLLSFLLLALFRKKFFLPLVLLLSGLGLFGFLSGGSDSVIPDFLTSPFLLYFAAGLLIGKYRGQIQDKLNPIAEWLFFLSIILLFTVMLGTDGGYDFTGISREMVVFDGNTYPRFLIWGLPSLLFFLSYFTLGQKYNIKNRFLNNLGDSSYSIYLLQGFFISLFTLELAYLLNDTGKLLVSVLLMIVLVCVSFLSYRYFEKRFHK